MSEEERKRRVRDFLFEELDRVAAEAGGRVGQQLMREKNAAQEPVRVLREAAELGGWWATRGGLMGSHESRGKARADWEKIKAALAATANGEKP